MVSKEAALQKISQLVERFSEQIGSYKHSDYNETLTRRDFIDPFFKALGWDMDNEHGNAEAYREVIHEDKIKIGSATKAPDYSFRLAGGKRLFFVEAKKPSVFVKEEIPPAYQIRRYGWSAKLPVSIVTDFEEFAIYDCTKKPKATDKASAARIKYLNYKEYITEFDFLWDTFSKERVLKGSFDKFVLSDTGKKGTATVDKEFLDSLNEWRKLLAETISINNVKLNEDQLNFAVQQTLDRIIFLRICEDRGVEPYEKLKYCLNAPLKEWVVYKNLFVYFEEADKKYNSGLFDLNKDNDSRKLNIDNKVLKKIIEELYYPVSPYEFSVLSVEILGSAYEQFLGKVIRLTPSHKAKIEEKPEVRKAGGVYYTPQYIVDYIVKNTVGKLIEGKSPKEVEKLKIVDPACGSGSFLIGAYQYLLDWHLSYYMGKGAKEKTLTPDGRLTTAEKKKILINNIYGVDIDTQATEVTKLSLLLKCMEGETLASVQQTMSFMHERILPTLENNIKSGNSLIDLDFYDGELEFAGTERKIKPFNWQAAFPKVFKQGGFDCVIGNPPWSSKMPNELAVHISNKYKIESKNLNLFAPFVYISLVSLLNVKGIFGMLVPKVFIKNTSYTQIRKFILEDLSLLEIFDFGKFPGVASDCVCPIIKKDRPSYTKLKVFHNSVLISENTVEQKIFTKNPVYAISFTINTESQTLLTKITNNEVLSNICDIKRGIELGQKSELTKCDECGYWNESGSKYYNTNKNKTCKSCSKKLLFRINTVISSLSKSKKYTLPTVSGRNIEKYNILDKYYILDKLYGIDYKGDIFKGERIFLKRISTKPEGMYIPEKSSLIAFNTVYSLYNIKKIDSKCLLGIINSKLISYFYESTFNLGMNLTTQITIEYLKQLPIPKIDFTNPAEKKRHDEIVKHVETMLELNKELQKSKPGEEQERLKQRITYIEKKIDALVYELYGLTEEEIKIVEGG